MKIGCHSSKTPEPIDITFDVGNYVGDVTPHAETQNDRPFWSVWEKYNSREVCTGCTNKKQSHRKNSLSQLL